MENKTRNIIDLILSKFQFIIMVMSTFCIILLFIQQREINRLRSTIDSTELGCDLSAIQWQLDDIESNLSSRIDDLESNLDSRINDVENSIIIWSR
jgi:hypothetical protein